LQLTSLRDYVNKYRCHTNTRIGDKARNNFKFWTTK
jgi:hypothetical protein